MIVECGTMIAGVNLQCPRRHGNTAARGAPTSKRSYGSMMVRAGKVADGFVCLDLECVGDPEGTRNRAISPAALDQAWSARFEVSAPRQLAQSWETAIGAVGGVVWSWR